MLVGWSVVCHPGNRSDVTLSYKDAQGIPLISREETCDAENTVDTDDTDDADDTIDTDNTDHTGDTDGSDDTFWIILGYFEILFGYR